MGTVTSTSFIHDDLTADHFPREGEDVIYRSYQVYSRRVNADGLRSRWPGQTFNLLLARHAVDADIDFAGVVLGGTGSASGPVSGDGDHGFRAPGCETCTYHVRPPS